MSLVLTGLRKTYGATRAVDGVSLTVASSETLALLGPSGCGKSTLLRLVAGLEPPDAGTVELDGRDITTLPASRRGFGVVFQDFALFPHLDVAGNVSFALVERGMSRPEAREIVGRLLAQVGLAGFERRKIAQLSGGQQQRVALARALAHEPRLLLLDEPLSNLDEALREELKGLVAALLEELGTQAIYVTHDQEEAFSVADRVAVMRAGALVQVGTRAELLERPRGAWVARFLGHDNVWQGPKGAALAREVGATAGPGGLLLRTELVALTPTGTPGTVSARVEDSRAAGMRTELRLAVDGWGGERLRWEGQVRELLAAGVPPDSTGGAVLGTEVGLHVPAHAWVALEDDS